MFKKVSEQDQVIINVIDQALAADMEPEKVAEFIEQVAASVWMFPPFILVSICDICKVVSHVYCQYFESIIEFQIRLKEEVMNNQKSFFNLFLSIILTT